MITSSLRRAVRSHPSPQSISRPSTPSIAASFSSRSHQRRQSSSKPPVPPNDGAANVPNPSVKTVGTPRPKDGSQKQPGAESRLSRRKIPRDRNEHATDGKDEWALDLPSVPSTQHLDPKGNGPSTLHLKVLSDKSLRNLCGIFLLQSPTHVGNFICSSFSSRRSLPVHIYTQKIHLEVKTWHCRSDIHPCFGCTTPRQQYRTKSKSATKPYPESRPPRPLRTHLSSHTKSQFHCVKFVRATASRRGTSTKYKSSSTQWSQACYPANCTAISTFQPSTSSTANYRCAD
jgi:hypothetical protein